MNLKFGKSALHEAALGGHHTIVHRLISGGAKIDLTDEVCNEKNIPTYLLSLISLQIRYR